MSRFARTYSGGYWRFFELSNGGFHMSPPDEAYELCIDSNGFEGRMSADAAGITVCLFALSYLSFDYTTDVFICHFHWLATSHWIIRTRARFLMPSTECSGAPGGDLKSY